VRDDGPFTGTDTNMILYGNDLNGLAGNDDVDTTRGELRSRVTVSINYDGFLYILVGQGYAVPNFQASQYNYALQCTTPGNAVVSPTATPPGGGPTRTPVPPPTAQPSATTSATPMPPISVRALPTPTPAGPARQMVTADLRVYYDVNKNSVADPGEGVVGLPVRVYDEVAGALLAQGFTDESGRAVFTVPSAGPIRVVVPYLDFQAIVPPSGAAIPVLISPRELPSQIPSLPGLRKHHTRYASQEINVRYSAETTPAWRLRSDDLFSSAGRVGWFSSRLSACVRNRIGISFAITFYGKRRHANASAASPAPPPIISGPSGSARSR